MKSLTVYCGECRNRLNGRSADPSLRVPCPECGSMRRFFDARLVDAVIEPKSMLGLKQKRPGVPKPLLDAKHGKSQSADGTWADVDQVIDRTVDPPIYRKRVVKADGSVVRNVSHLLSEHTGRGSASRKRKP